MWQDTQSYIDECPGNGVRKKIHKDLSCNWGQFGWYRQLGIRAAFFIIWWQPRILSKSKPSQELLFIWKVCLVITSLKINTILIFMSPPLFFPHRDVVDKCEANVLWWLVWLLFPGGWNGCWNQHSIANNQFQKVPVTLLVFWESGCRLSMKI